MDEHFDLLSIGDAAIDTFMTPLESETLCKMDSTKCRQAFRNGYYSSHLVALASSNRGLF